MLALEALRAARLQDSPFRWAYVEDGLDSPAAAEELLATFPATDFWHIRGNDGEKRSDYTARPLITLGAEEPAALSPLAPAWDELARDLLSPGYRAAIASLTGVDLDEAEMEASIWRWDRAAQLGPHRDLPEKLLTHVVYLGAQWDVSWGGNLRILRSQDESDVEAELAPRLGAASVLVRSDRSWHSVTPVTSAAAEPRRNVIVTWFAPGSRSPVWRVEDDGKVECASGHRAGASALARAAGRLKRLVRRRRP